GENLLALGEVARELEDRDLLGPLAAGGADGGVLDARGEVDVAVGREDDVLLGLAAPDLGADVVRAGGDDEEDAWALADEGLVDEDGRVDARADDEAVVAGLGEALQVLEGGVDADGEVHVVGAGDV